MSEIRMLLKPMHNYTNLMLGWMTTPSTVQVHTDGIEIKKLARKLVDGLGLKPGSGQKLPPKLKYHPKLDGRIKAAVGYILERGYWNPTVRPYEGNLEKGFELKEQSYSRVIPLCWKGNAFRLAGEELKGFHCVSPEALNQTTEEDYAEGDRSVFRLFKDAHPAFASREASRTKLLPGTTLGKPWFRAQEETEFDPVWVRSTKADPAELVGEEVPGIALLSGHDEHFAHFQWFTKIVERDEKRIVNLFNIGRPLDVLEVRYQDFGKIFPKIELHPDDFSEEDRAANREFFNGWRSKLK